MNSFSKHPTCVLFDFYDTLVEIDQDVPRLWEVLKNLGYNGFPELETIWNSDAFNGMETPTALQKPTYYDWRRNNLKSMALAAGVTSQDVEEVVDQLLYVDQSWTVKARAGAKETLNLLRDCRVPFGICTNWDYDLKEYLHQSDLGDVKHVVTSSSIGFRKPHPKIFLAACRLLDSEPKDIFFVGDSWENDVVGAVRVGMKAVWVKNTKDIGFSDYLTQIKSLEEFPDFIENHILSGRHS